MLSPLSYDGRPVDATHGALGRNRTCYLLVRNQVLSPMSYEGGSQSLNGVVLVPAARLERATACASCRCSCR